MIEPLRKKLQSRKFVLTVLVAVLALVNTTFDLGMDNAAIATIAASVGAWVLGEVTLDRERIRSEQQARFAALQQEATDVVTGLNGQLAEAQAFIQNLVAEQSVPSTQAGTPEEFASHVMAVADLEDEDV